LKPPRQKATDEKHLNYNYLKINYRVAQKSLLLIIIATTVYCQPTFIIFDTYAL